ncbi:MAG: metalloprotease family protein [Ignisphaera sp.]
MKLKIVLQIVMGLLITWIIVERIGYNVAISMCFLTPLLGLVHEALHYVYIRMFKVNHRFTFKGMYIGFHITVDSVDQLMVIAVAPQILTLSLLITYVCFTNNYAIALALYHITLSLEDILIIVKYLPHYFS